MYIYVYLCMHAHTSVGQIANKKYSKDQDVVLTQLPTAALSSSMHPCIILLDDSVNAEHEASGEGEAAC